MVSINVLVAKCGKSCGPVSIFHKRNLRTKPKNLILHILAKFTSDILNSKSFKTMEITRVSHEQYPEEEYRFWLSSFIKKLVSFYKGLLDVTTNIAQIVCIKSRTECRTFFRGNLKNPKTSVDTQLTFP